MGSDNRERRRPRTYLHLPNGGSFAELSGMGFVSFSCSPSLSASFQSALCGPLPTGGG